MKTPHITHVITGLGVGGTEMMLVRLLGELLEKPVTFDVVALRCDGPIAEQIRDLGIPVRTLKTGVKLPDLTLFFRLQSSLRLHKTDLVVSWLYHGDLFGGLAAKLRRHRIPVVWNVRNSLMLDGHASWHARVAAKMCSRMSRRVPEAIVFNSSVARDEHERFGYRGETMPVIRNGFDTNRFRPSSEAYQQLRTELNLPPNAMLIGLAGRYHPVKQHALFIKAAAAIHHRRPDIRFVMFGTSIEWTNEPLSTLILQRGLQHVFHCLGPQQHPEQIYAGLDLAVCCSDSEAFPNVVGEAMACEIPCVCTDVGDARILIGSTGRVVPVRDAKKLADACLDIIGLSENIRLAIGQRARHRVETLFSLPRIARDHYDVWSSCLPKLLHSQNKNEIDTSDQRALSAPRAA